ncbi:MAG: hypothetical protein FJZ64_03670 [Chlamydiae bacterium]|nr:hypothetical protein [Chlamydiota bacterium]
MIELQCSCPHLRSIERIEDRSFFSLIKRVAGSVGEALRQLSYVVFLASVAGFSVVALADPFAHLFNAPFYLMIASSITCLFGAFLQGLAGRSVNYYCKT